MQYYDTNTRENYIKRYNTLFKCVLIIIYAYCSTIYYCY